MSCNGNCLQGRSCDCCADVEWEERAPERKPSSSSFEEAADALVYVLVVLFILATVGAWLWPHLT